MKKLIALLLSVLLALTSMAPAYAAKPYLENQNFSIEASIDELADGITFAIIQDADGSLTVQKIEQGDISLQANQRVAGKFHCGLTYHKNASTAHIHWTATSSQLTAVRARVYCKPTYIIGGDYGKYFFYGDIDEYRDLGGRYNTANGATDDFDIDSGLKKVNIGWTSASITTVRGGTLALPSSIDRLLFGEKIYLKLEVNQEDVDKMRDSIFAFLKKGEISPKNLQQHLKYLIIAEVVLWLAFIVYLFISTSTVL